MANIAVSRHVFPRCDGRKKYFERNNKDGGHPFKRSDAVQGKKIVEERKGGGRIGSDETSRLPPVQPGARPVAVHVVVPWLSGISRVAQPSIIEEVKTADHLHLTQYGHPSYTSPTNNNKKGSRIMSHV